MCANFQDGTHLNLIKLTKPYANGAQWAIHDTTNNPYCKSMLIKNQGTATRKFYWMAAEAKATSPLKELLQPHKELL